MIRIFLSIFVLTQSHYSLQSPTCPTGYALEDSCVNGVCIHKGEAQVCCPMPGTGNRNDCILPYRAGAARVGGPMAQTSQQGPICRDGYVLEDSCVGGVCVRGEAKVCCLKPGTGNRDNDCVLPLRANAGGI